MNTPAQVFAVACLIVAVGLVLTVATWHFEQWLRECFERAARNAETRRLRRLVEAEEERVRRIVNATPIYDAVADVIPLHPESRPTGGAA